MLSSDRIASQLLDVCLGPVGECVSDWLELECRREDSHITECNHADGLPDTQADTGSNAAVKTTDTILLVDVLESGANRHLLGSVGILLLALHLNTDNLNWLIPCAETTTKRACEDLLQTRQLLVLLLAGSSADPALGKTAETEARTPVGHLSDSDSVDTLVDTSDTLLAVDVHEGREGGLGLDTGGSQLVLGDLDRLHAGAETHGSISLSDTTGNTTDDTTTKLRGTHRAGVILGFGGDEEEDGALGGRFNPGPGDETLIDLKDMSMPSITGGLG